MRTLADKVSAEFVIRHSRFVVHAGPVADEPASMAFINAVSDGSATHNCWAWKLDRTYRFSDDAEPAGTAGRPILTAIDGKQLCRVAVVVTRYFGGVKLGAGGLIRAYSGCTARCLDQGTLIEVHATSRWEIEAGFQWTAQVYAALESCEARTLEMNHTARGITLHIEIRDDHLKKLQSMLSDTTRGSARLSAV